MLHNNYAIISNENIKGTYLYQVLSLSGLELIIGHHW